MRRCYVTSLLVLTPKIWHTLVNHPIQLIESCPVGSIACWRRQLRWTELVGIPIVRERELAGSSGSKGKGFGRYPSARVTELVNTAVAEDKKGRFSYDWQGTLSLVSQQTWGWSSAITTLFSSWNLSTYFSSYTTTEPFRGLKWHITLMVHSACLIMLFATSFLWCDPHYPSTPASRFRRLFLYVPQYLSRGNATLAILFTFLPHSFLD